MVFFKILNSSRAMENSIQYASHIITTILAVGILMNIWWFYNQQKAKLNIQEKKDYGIVLLSIAMLNLKSQQKYNLKLNFYNYFQSF